MAHGFVWLAGNTYCFASFLNQMGPAEPREKSFKTIQRCSSMLDRTVLKHSGGAVERKHSVGTGVK